MSDHLQAQELARIEAAIQAQEASRGLIPDEQLNLILASLREKRTALLAQLAGSGAIAQGEGARAAGERGLIADSISGSAVVTGDNNSVTYIVHQYIAKGGSLPDQAELRRQMANYLNWVRDHCGTLELRGIKREGQQVVQLPLDTVYIPLEAEVYEPPRVEHSPHRPMDVEHSPHRPMDVERSPHRPMDIVPEPITPRSITLGQVLGLGERIILTGGPGCGKTTVLLHIAWTLAEAIAIDKPALAKDRLGLEGALPLPIFVPLSAYAAHLRRLPATANPHDRTLAAFISRYLIEKQTCFDLPDDFFQQLMRDGRAAILLLDGLDEVPDEAERARVRQAVEELVTGRETMRVAVTCRTAAYRDRTALGKGFREVRVEPLDDEHIQALVQAACNHLYRHDPATRQAKADELLQGIRRLEEERRRRLGKEVERLITSPLLVRMLIVVHFSERRLPEQRAELYMKATDAMLLPEYGPDEEIADRLGRLVGGSREVHREMVQHLAFAMHSRGETQGREIEEDDLRRVLGRLSAYASMVDDLIALTKLRGTLLEERLGVYRFIHLAFQEYLAARYLAEIKRGESGVEGIAAFLEKGPILDSWWREPIMLVAGYLSVTTPQTARLFLRRLASTDDGAARRTPLVVGVQLAGAETAGAALLEWQSLAADLRDELAARLAALFRNSDLMNRAHPSWRAAAGNTLARLGDPRKEAMTLDAMEFCLVPHGPFWMDEEGDIHLSNYLDYDYWMARYPVTVAQFRVFVEASGYQPRVEDSLRGLPNHPVVHVTWYDAQAFCEWLTKDWQRKGWLPQGWAVQLPSEAEWEKAARGGLQIANIKCQVSNLRGEMGRQVEWQENPNLKRVYPWSDKADPNLANYDQTAINAASAVGCFPGGASPYGCEDMSGNVWEWTRSVYKDYPYDPKDGRESLESLGRRVLRGGAFFDFANLVRCAVRNWVDPDVWYDYVGYRVVLSPL